MKAITLKINGTRIVPVDTIRSIKPLSAEDRSRAGGKLEIDALKFNVASSSLTRAPNSLWRRSNRLSVRAWVWSISALTALCRPSPSGERKSGEDAAKLKDSGDYTLSQEFRSRVQTTAGTILSTLTAEQVMERRGRVLGHGTNVNAWQTRRRERASDQAMKRPRATRRQQVKVGAVPDPVWGTEPDLLQGHSLIHLRDPRYGWLYYLLPPHEAAGLAAFLTKQAELATQQPDVSKRN